MHSGAHVPCTRPERPPLPSYQRAPGRVAERLRCEVVPGRRWRSHAMRRCLWLRQSETNACALIVRSLVCKTQSEAVGARRVNTDCDSCCAGVTYHLPTCRSAMRYERSPPAISTVADTRTLARMIQASKTGFSAPSCATTVRCLSPTLRISVSYIAILDRCRRTYALCTNCHVSLRTQAYCRTLNHTRPFLTPRLLFHIHASIISRVYSLLASMTAKAVGSTNSR